MVTFTTGYFIYSPKTSASVSIFSSFSNTFINSVSANTNNFSIISPENNTSTSKDMQLLEANNFSIHSINEKKKNNEKKNENEEITIYQNALSVSKPLVGESNNNNIGGGSSDSISVYVVRKGDTISEIAEMFEVTQNTILWANDMKKGDKIKEGDILLILPVSGVEHTVKKGETIKKIAEKYKVDTNEILLYNGLEEGTNLAVGDSLIIPGAEMFDIADGDNNTKKVSSASNSSGKISSSKSKNLLNSNKIEGYFINPLPSGHKTRGITNTHYGVDIGAPIGTPIHASASGQVTLSRTGYNGGYGTLVVLKHPNGTETLYAHMSKLGTSVGAEVAQGETIGFVGSTGRSTGPHLHFEVKGAYNPGQDYSWAK